MSALRKGTIRIVESVSRPDAFDFLIECPPHVSVKLRRVFGAIQRWRAGVFRLSATPANAFELDWFMKRHELDFIDDSENRFHKLVATEKRKQRSIQEIEAPDYVPPEFNLALPPRDYQRVAADLAIRTGALLIADHLGLGKTVSAIAALSAKGMLPAVIVTMTHLPRQWEREFSRFAPRLRVHRIRKGQPYDFKTIKYETTYAGIRRQVIPGVPDVIVMNYHKLDGWADTLATLVKTVVFDEIQELRHDGTNKYNAAVAVSRAAAYRIGLSATPIYNYGSEIFNVMDALASGCLGTRKEFYDEWCSGANPSNEQDARKVCVADPQALGTYLREAGLMIRRTRKEVGRELPPLTIVRHVVEIDPKRINEVTADVAELATRILARTGTNFELMKWSGEIDYLMRQATGIAKAPAIVDFVRLLVDNGERVVLFGWHHGVYAILRDGFAKHGIPFAMYTGSESESEKEQSLKRFKAAETDEAGTPQDHAKVLIISLRAGAGLDGLQHVCRTVVIGELDWSPLVHDQDIGRVNRDGQTEPVTAYYLVAEEGSDPVVADALGIKEAQSTGIVDPDKADTPNLVGIAADHIKRLAADVLTRRGLPIPKPVDKPVDDPPPSQVQMQLGLGG